MAFWHKDKRIEFIRAPISFSCGIHIIHTRTPPTHAQRTAHTAHVLHANVDLQLCQLIKHK